MLQNSKLTKIYLWWPETEYQQIFLFLVSLRFFPVFLCQSVTGYHSALYSQALVSKEQFFYSLSYY